MRAPARASLARQPDLVVYLSGLPSLELSETGRRNVCGRFGLTEEELTKALAGCCPPAERRPSLPVPAKEFGADALACALSLTGTAWPTAAQLDAALCEMYPCGGPTAASLVAAGLLVPTIDKTALRLPPPAVAVGRPFPSPATPQRNGNR